MSEADKITMLQTRIAELERALEPFAHAAAGFTANFDASLLYKETDDIYYPLYMSDDKSLPTLKIEHLLDAEFVMWKRPHVSDWEASG